MENDVEINRKKLLKRIAFLIVAISVFNFLAMKFYWYFSIWWLDMLMHLLGGIWLGLGLIFLFKTKDFSIYSIVKITLGVLVIGISWEIFEILVDKATTQNSFNALDTFSDICFAFAGGFISMLYFQKRLLLKRDVEI